MEKWFALYTKPHAEYQVAASLENRGMLTFLPEMVSTKARKQGEKKPFFPCYLFVRVDFEQVGLSLVEWTPGLRRIVTVDGRPVPLPDHVVDLIQRRLASINAAGGLPVPGFDPGETVRIVDGPLQGVLAVFEGPSTPAQRVRVLLDFLGHVSRAYVSVFDLEKVAAQTQTPTPKRPRRTRGKGRPIKNNKNILLGALPE